MARQQRWLLWRLLGGGVNEEGKPIPTADDWVPVFSGPLVQARYVDEQLRREGLETRVNTAHLQVFGRRRRPVSDRWSGSGRVSLVATVLVPTTSSDDARDVVEAESGLDNDLPF